VVNDIPPHNLEAEMAVLGSVMIDRSMWDVVAPLVQARDFYAHAHERLWLVLAKLAEAGKPLDKITVVEELRGEKAFEGGGIAYLNGLLSIVPTAASAEYYARIVADKAALRRLATIFRQGAEFAMTERFADSIGLTDWAQGQLITGAGVRKSIEGLPGSEVINGIRYAIENPRDRQPFFTPWSNLDKLTGGFKPGELVFWAASPGMGKSVTQINLAHYNAVKYGKSHGEVLFFALEMGSAATAERMLAMHSGVQVRNFRLGNLSEIHRRWVASSAEHLEALPIRYFDRVPRLTLHEIKMAARMAASRTGVAAIHIDHIGYLADLVEAGMRGNKHAVLDAALMELVNLSAELKCAMHVVFHLNRDARDKEPTIFHLRDGGNSEGHATTVIFPWRPNPDGDPEKPEAMSEGVFVVAKVRDGQPGRVPMNFDGGALLWTQAGDVKPWYGIEADVARRRAAIADGADPETGEVRMPFKDSA
jgi:replicative DNA helicase